MTKTIYTAYLVLPPFAREKGQEFTNLRLAKRAMRKALKAAGFGWTARIESEGMERITIPA